MISRMHLGGWSVVAILAIVLGPAASLANSFDPAAQFSPVVNPNGVWSYGFENFPLPNPFQLLTLPVVVPGAPVPIDSWQAPAFGEVGVLHNGTAVPTSITILIDNAIYQPGELAMHPGPNDQYGVVQFKAPVAGNYTILGTFEGIDTTGLTNTDVHLLWNNAVVQSGAVVGDGPGSDVPLIWTAFLNPGDTLGFAVGGNPFHGTTALLAGAEVASDSDGDGIPDTSDNCPNTPNGPLLGTCLGNFPQGQATCHANSDCTSGICSMHQEDTGGVGTGSPPDGIGDACQCGDVNNDGVVNNNDATLIKRAVAGIAPYPGGVTTLPGYHKCQVVTGSPPGDTCNNTQATIISRAVAGLAPGIQQGCHAATTFP